MAENLERPSGGVNAPPRSAATPPPTGSTPHPTDPPRQNGNREEPPRSRAALRLRISPLTQRLRVLPPRLRPVDFRAEPVPPPPFRFGVPFWDLRSDAVFAAFRAGFFPAGFPVALRAAPLSGAFAARFRRPDTAGAFFPDPRFAAFLDTAFGRFAIAATVLATLRS